MMNRALRAAVTSIALVLAVAQSGALLCRTWCQPQPESISDCGHGDSGPSPGLAEDECPPAALTAIFITETVRRYEPPSIGQPPILAHRDRLNLPATVGRPAHLATPLPSPDDQARNTTLRL
jgi:hypothetical protein